MKSIAIATIAAVLCLSFVALATPPELPKDGAKIKIMAHAPSAGKDQILTVNSTTVDMSSDLSWGVYSPVDCKFRTMSTSTKVGVQKTIPSGAWHVRGLRDRSRFVNYSGCTAAELERQ